MGKAQARQGSFVRRAQKTPAPKTRRTHFRVESSFKDMRRSKNYSIICAWKKKSLQTSNSHLLCISLSTYTFKLYLIKRTAKVCVCVYASRFKGVVHSQSPVTFLWSPTTLSILTSDPLTSARYFPSHKVTGHFLSFFTALCQSSRWLYRKKQINSFLFLNRFIY